MQEDARQTLLDRRRSLTGAAPSFSSLDHCCSGRNFQRYVRCATRRATPPGGFPTLVATRLSCLSQIEGWPVKAHEFINSGPPVLLNNPRCSWRVVCSPFINK